MKVLAAVVDLNQRTLAFKAVADAFCHRRDYSKGAPLRVGAPYHLPDGGLALPLPGSLFATERLCYLDSTLTTGGRVDQETQEARVRRLAARYGYRLRKARWAVGANNAGAYMLRIIRSNRCLTRVRATTSPWTKSSIGSVPKTRSKDHRHVWALEATREHESAKASSFNGNPPNVVLHVMSQLPCCIE